MIRNLRRLTSPLAPPVPDPEITPPIPVRDEAARALLALVHACAVPTAFTGAREIQGARNSLARAVVARLLQAPSAPSADEMASAADELTGAVRGVLGETFTRRVPAALEKVPDHLLAVAGQVLRVQALEHHGSELALARDGDGLVALRAPVSAAQAHVWLLQPLYDRVEEWVAEDVPTAREREASRWWFSRWRSPRPFRGDEFAHGVREQEFSLVERTCGCLGVSPLEYMVEDDLLGDAGPRERHVARCLLDSMVGAWRVEARSDADVTLRHPLEGTRYQVREHAPVHRYDQGGVLLGRLIPFGDGTWLRSPGALIIPGEGGELARRLAEGVEKGSKSMYPEAAVEAMLHTIMGVRGIPRDVLPNATPDEAVELLKAIHQTLRDVGEVEDVDPATYPEAAELAIQQPNTKLFRMSVDVVLAEYTSALFDLSKKSRALRQTLRRRERDAKKRRRK